MHTPLLDLPIRVTIHNTGYIIHSTLYRCNPQVNSPSDVCSNSYYLYRPRTKCFLLRLTVKQQTFETIKRQKIINFCFKNYSFSFYDLYTLFQRKFKRQGGICNSTPLISNKNSLRGEMIHSYDLLLLIYKSVKSYNIILYRKYIFLKVILTFILV